MASWNIRRYRDGDKEAIVELLRIVFGKGYTREYWNWKYRENPGGPSMVWLAEHDGKIVGHYGIIPVPMKLGNSYIKGSFSTDAATHPLYRGQGVFSALVNRAYLDVAGSQVPLTYGLPRVEMGPIYKRYEWAGHICFMRYMVKILNWNAALGRYIDNELVTGTISSVLGKMRRPMSPPDGSVEIEEISRFDGRIDRFWADASRCFTVIVRRDQTRLNWRYADHPQDKYTIYTAVKGDRILGYCVLKIGPGKGRGKQENLRVGFIVDIIGIGQDIVGCLVRWAANWFEKHNVDVVACMMSEGHPYPRAFRSAGFVTYPCRNVALKATVNLPGTSIDERQTYSQALVLSQNYFLRDKRNWFVISGDGA